MENLLTCLLVLLYLWELYIYGERYSKIGSWCHNVNHFHIVWFIFTSIQYLVSFIVIIFPRPQDQFCQDRSLFNTSDSVAVLWLTATLARINTSKWSLKKNQAKLNAIAEDFSLKKFIYIQGSPALCQPFFPSKPHTQTFLTLNLNEPRGRPLF